MTLIIGIHQVLKGLEKAHLQFCNIYLGVNKKASNIACRAEMGRFPAKLDRRRHKNFEILDADKYP